MGCSYVLQEWGSSLGSEEPYEKAARFLETVLEMSLWGSTIETVIQTSRIDVPDFYKERQGPDARTEKEILVAAMDGKEVVMRKNQLEQRTPKKQLRKPWTGVVEEACKNLVKDRMEQCGMRWTIPGAEAVLGMRSIQINRMTSDYWRYHIARERKRLYGTLIAA